MLLFRSSCMCTRCWCTHKLNRSLKDVYVKFVSSASAPCTHAWTPEKNRPEVYVKFVSASAPYTHAWTPEKNCLILIILQCNTEYKNIFLHIPGLKITKIKILWNVVDDVGTLTTWRHMKTSNLKPKDQTSLGLVQASILIKFN